MKQYLHFDNLNFKLVIIQVLMYDLGLLEPFDIYDFAEQHPELEIDTESEEIIEPALRYFQELKIPRKLADKVESIYMDGGNDVYMNIIPLWNGEDEVFDLETVSREELEQFPNLKEATILSNNFAKVKEIFESFGVTVDSL